MNNLHPTFKDIFKTFDPYLSAAEKRKERINSKERLKLLIVSADAILDGIITGKYGTWDQALLAIADWRQMVKDEGISL